MDKQTTIFEVSTLCDDVQLVDFSSEDYSSAYYRSIRDIAKRYNIFECVLQFSPTEDEQEIEVQIPGFFNETAVYVNDRLLTKSDAVFDSPTPSSETLIKATALGIEKNDLSGSDNRDIYYLRTLNGKRFFGYGNMLKTDVIVFYYRIIPDAQYLVSNENNYPVLPIQLEEEVIRETILYLCKIAAARFANEGAKLGKWSRIFKVHQRTNSDHEKRDVEDRAWTHIRPFQPL